MKNINNYIEKKGFAFTNSVYDPKSNLREIASFFDSHSKIMSMAFSPVNDNNTTYYDRFLEKEMLEFRQELDEIYLDFFNEEDLYKCLVGTFATLSNGDIVPCLGLKDFKVGRIDKIYDIFTEDKLLKYWDMSNRDITQCKDCGLRYACNDCRSPEIRLGAKIDEKKRVRGENMSILTLENVSKEYSKKIALKNINLSFDENCIVGLVGPNGAGKTTLFRLIMNLIEPTTGKIKLWNQDNCTNIVGNNISYCSDGDNLYEDLTVGENLEFIVRAYGIHNGNKKIEELSYLLDMDQELNTQVKNLSRGMRKKVALIRTLINETAMIIMDEPMSWLDVDNQKRLTMLLKSMSKKSLIIISSHNMAQVEKICDKVILLNQEIKYFGNIGDIDYGNIIKLKIEYVKESYNPELKKELTGIKGVLDVYSEEETLYIEYDNSIGDIENQIISCVLQRYKLNVKKINHIEKSLEDLYFEKVR